MNLALAPIQPPPDPSRPDAPPATPRVVVLVSAIDFPEGAPAYPGLHVVTGRLLDGAPVLDPPDPGAAAAAALALSDDGFADLTALVAALRAERAIAIPDPARAETSSPEGALAAIVASLAAELHDARLETVSLAGALAHLRIAHAQLQDSFALVEALVQARRLASPALSFAEAPTGWISLAEADGLAPLRLLQRLPAPPYGLAAIALALAGDVSQYAGWRLSLGHLESGATLHAWTPRPPRERDGWSVFALPRALSIGIGTLEVRLERVAPGRLGPTVGVAEGVANPIHACRLIERGGATHALDQALALRIWTLPPDLSTEEAHFERVQPLPPAALSDVRPVRPAPRDDGARYVHALTAENALFCHPTETGPTLACLGAVLPAEAERVVVTAVLDHRDSEPVEFALLLARDDAAADAALAAAPWRAVGAGGSERLSLDIAPDLDRAAAHLYVATRMQAGAGNRYAWAKARDIGFVLARETRP